MAEIKFVNGLKVDRHEKAPEWVVANLSFNVADITYWLQQNQLNGYVKVDIKKSKKGSMYACLNDFKPQKKAQAQLDSFGSTESDEIPF